jgi:hypothetical protein
LKRVLQNYEYAERESGREEEEIIKIYLCNLLAKYFTFLFSFAACQK